MSGSGTDGYGYTQDYTFMPIGQWLLTGGSGGASGAGSVTGSWSANGAYSTADPAWSTSPVVGMGSAYSGTVSGSAGISQSYGYSTTSTFDPSGESGGWTTTGSQTATASGWTGSSFSASSPFSSNLENNNYYAGIYNSASLSGTISGSGSDWSNYSYTQPQTLADGAWSNASGTGAASGGATALWSYGGGASGGPSASNAASGTYSQSYGGGSASGTLGEWGGENYSLGYGTTASLPADDDYWTQAGSGTAAATSTYGYAYSGAGGGSSSWIDEGHGQRDVDLDERVGQRQRFGHLERPAHVRLRFLERRARHIRIIIDGRKRLRLYRHDRGRRVQRHLRHDDDHRRRDHECRQRRHDLRRHRDGYPDADGRVDGHVRQLVVAGR